MATWTNVSNTVLEPGDPIRSVDIIAIKENVIALSEGASGAPKIVAAALNTGTNERNWVLARYASVDFNGVGSYVVAYYGIGAPATPGSGINVQMLLRGSTVAGSSLFVSSRGTGAVSNPPVNEAGSPNSIAATLYNSSSGTFPTANKTSLSGTWRFMTGGAVAYRDEGSTGYWPTGLWMRIS